MLALAAVAGTLLSGRDGGGSGDAISRDPGRGGPREPLTARVDRVVDGDTIFVALVDSGNHEEYVRLLGIDTPETKKPGVPIECGGPEASQNLERLLPPGSLVRLDTDPTQDQVDRYGRLLAYVRLRDGRLAEEEQVASGWANVYVYEGRPVSRDPELRRAMAAARAAHRGVWGECGGDFHSAGG